MTASRKCLFQSLVIGCMLWSSYLVLKRIGLVEKDKIKTFKVSSFVHFKIKRITHTRARARSDAHTRAITL